MKGKSLPPIPIHQADVRRRGCFDSAAFEAQAPGRTVYTNPYEQISKLSERADALKQENEILRQELYDIVMTTQDNPFVQYKKNLLAFSAKMTQRERELTDVCNYLSIAKKSTQPAFVEISQIQNKQYSFDTVATSLLVANQQRSFFTSDEIAVQNEQIRSLISKMSEDLKQLNTRLAIYEQNYQDNIVRFKMNSLKRKKNPLDLVDTSPGKVAEQNIKIKLLQKELRHLVNRRVKAQKEMYSVTRRVSTPKQPHSSRQAPRPNPTAIMQSLAESSPREETIDEMIFSGDKEETIQHPIVEPPPRTVPARPIRMPETPEAETQNDTDNSLIEKGEISTIEQENLVPDNNEPETSTSIVTDERNIILEEEDKNEEVIHNEPTSETNEERKEENIDEENNQEEILDREEEENKEPIEMKNEDPPKHADVPEFRQPPKNENFTEFWRST